MAWTPPMMTGIDIPKPARFELSDLMITPANITIGESANMTVDIGDLPGILEVLKPVEFKGESIQLVP